MDKDQNTEQRILAAAKQAFMEKGLAGARMQDIADKAGINKALLHYYFRSKDKLFEVIFMEAAAEFLPRISALMFSDQPLFEKIEGFVNEYIGMILKNPYLPLFILNEMNRQPQPFIKKLWGAKRPPVERLAEQIEQEVKRGNIKPIHPAHFMMNMVAMCMFPFIARPMVQWIHKLDEKQFLELMEQRKKEVAKFIIDSIRK